MVYRVELDRLPEVFRSVRLAPLWGVVALRGLALSLRALRFRHVLAASLRRSPLHALRATFIGAFFNLFLPLRGGEAARVAIVVRWNDFPALSVVATAALDRLLDLLSVCALLLLALPGATLPSWLVQSAAWVGALSVTLLLLVVFGRGVAGAVLRALAQRRRGRLLAGWGQAFVRGLAVVDQRRRLLAAASLGALGWLVEAMGVSLLLLAVGVPLDWQAALLLTCTVALGMGIPAGPGGLGPHQFIYVTLLALYGVDAATALSMSLLSVMLTMLVLAATGGVALWLESVALSPRRRSSGSP